VDETPTGNAVFALAADGYAIGLTFDIFNADDTPGVDPAVATPSSVIEDVVTTELSVELPVGDYNPEMVAWSMTGPGITGTATEANLTDNVAFVNFVTDPFAVTPGGDTGVSLEFTVGLETVVIALAGEAVFTANVTVSDACTPDCAGGDVCATVGGDDAECVQACNPEDDACTGGEFCQATTGGDVLGICR
jgi:hypothetical protein